MGGIARYTHELSKLLETSSFATKVILYGLKRSDGFSPANDKHGIRATLRYSLGGIKRMMSDQLFLPLAVHRNNVDLLHSTNFFVPLWSEKPVVVTCHDLSLLQFFTSKKKGLIKYYERFLLLNGLRRAAHVITPSNAVASELKQRFTFLEKKVTVIYPPMPCFCLDDQSAPDVLNENIPQQPFFLSVGSIEPRKNLFRLLEGWQRAYSQCGIPLVLVGPYGWKQRKLIREQLAATEDLYWLDNVNDATLLALYKKAIAVVQYSLYEGFDYPVAEALCMGKPVVASDIEVHREVLAGCGLFASASDTEILTAKLLEVHSWSDQKLTEFRQQARQRAGLITQQSSITPYVAVYKKVLGQKEW